MKNLSFGVHKAEVFGFLGTNGAGKTTTMSVLTGEFLPTHGHGVIAGHDIVAERSAALAKLGYCPQFDALIDLLTPTEHLNLYCALRAVSTPRVESVVRKLLEMCDLTAIQRHSSAAVERRESAEIKLSDRTGWRARGPCSWTSQAQVWTR